MIEVVAENGVFEFPVLPELWWAEFWDFALLMGLWAVVFAGPLVGGLKRWPFAHGLLLAVPLAFSTTVVMAMGLGDFYVDSGFSSEVWAVSPGLPLLVVAFGYSGGSYYIGQWIRRCWLRRRGLPDRFPEHPHSWPARIGIVAAPLLVGLVLFVLMVGNAHPMWRVGKLYAAEQAYVDLLERLLKDSEGALPSNAYALAKVMSDGADPGLRGIVGFQEFDFSVREDGMGYVLNFQESPRRIRGERGRIWIEEK